jgi:hypothetical protein
VAVEIKFSAAPQLSRGFYEGFSSLGCDRGFVVYPGKDTYEVKAGITVVPVVDIERIVAHARLSL